MCSSSSETCKRVKAQNLLFGSKQSLKHSDDKAPAHQALPSAGTGQNSAWSEHQRLGPWSSVFPRISRSTSASNQQDETFIAVLATSKNVATNFFQTRRSRPLACCSLRCWTSNTWSINCLLERWAWYFHQEVVSALNVTLAAKHFKQVTVLKTSTAASVWVCVCVPWCYLWLCPESQTASCLKVTLK